MEDLDGRVFDRPVHSLGLTIRPRMIRLCQPVLDAVLGTDTIEDVGADIAARAPFLFFGRSANAMPLSVSTVWFL